jgi:hypothetical protein
MHEQGQKRFPGPRVRDWSFVAISFGFVIVGLLALPSRPDVAVPVLAFFGVCAGVATVTVLRKLRFARLRPISVEIAGGTPIRPSRLQLSGLGVTLLGLGIVLISYWHSGPILVVCSIWGMIATGAFLLLGLVTGRLPVGFIQFDPVGLTIGRRADTFTLPWDCIASVAPAEYHDNPVLLLSVRDLDAVVVNPASARLRVIASFLSSLNWTGAHVMLMSSQYRIELPLLVTAIERYVRDPRAREGLATPRLPAGTA